MIRARDVAEELGVSVSTVGRAMADDPRISDLTKARVRRAAEKLGYIGNNAARIIRGGSSKLIGLMIPDVANEFYASIAQAMSSCLDRRGYRLVLSLTGDDRDVEHRHIRELVGARAAGVILTPTHNPRRQSRDMLRGVPHVQFLRHLPALGQSWFGMDDEAAIHRATSFLIDLGHRRIAYVGGSERLSTGACRVRGFRAALCEADLPLSADLERLGSPSAAFGAESLSRLLRLPQPPTAVLTGSVHITEGLVGCAERLLLDVPAAMSVVGFGGSSWFEWWRGGLTAVAPAIHELATECALWFVDQVESRPGEELVLHSFASSSTLVLRNSTCSANRL